MLLEAVTAAAARLAGLTPPSPYRPALTSGDARAQDDDDIIATAVVSLRTLDRWDWKPAAERLSVLHAILADGDPSGHYPAMEYDSRNRYRTAVEQVTRTSQLTETEVAQAAVGLAEQADTAQERHVGYYLIGDGARALEAAVGSRPPFGQRIRRTFLDRPTATYLLPILVIAAGIVAAAGSTPAAATPGPRSPPRSWRSSRRSPPPSTSSTGPSRAPSNRGSSPSWTSARASRRSTGRWWWCRAWWRARRMSTRS